MATAGGKKKSASQVSVSSGNRNIPPLYMDVARVRKPVEEDIVGWIAACILIALLLPIMGFLYLDILETKHEAKAQVEKVEKLRQKVEQQQREKDK